MLNLNKYTKTKPKATLVFMNCSYLCVCVCVCVFVSFCIAIVRNTAQNNSGNFLSYPADNDRSSDDVYWRGGERLVRQN